MAASGFNGVGNGPYVYPQSGLELEEGATLSQYIPVQDASAYPQQYIPVEEGAGSPLRYAPVSGEELLKWGALPKEKSSQSSTSSKVIHLALSTLGTVAAGLVFASLIIPNPIVAASVCLGGFVVFSLSVIAKDSLSSL